MKIIIGLFIVTILGGVGFIYSGLYPIGADNRHNALTFWLLETLRKKSISRASKDIEVPDLSDPQLLLSGGADYNDMCVGCHLKPGVTETDMTLGLYPAPPNLTLASDQHDHNHGEGGYDDPVVMTRQQFWVIKHGIIASGMAAFGPTHSDERIWAMVAFLRKLPELNETQYQILTARK
ncbi:cytochrome C oxidase Cbb3 [Candidatus Endobugula sertula]|uniref:Cytochrome C oxidase Cbb3 n=1 Tax=Candidatus Endobugula sertula TaxID=62101 RepID=A0A1D2QQI5_9GAMM|nr:cytochrome C oxidase Cbb3 [Candidatus Endobugula sertula]